MRRTIALDEEDLKKRARVREPTVAAQTYIWWYFSTARYRGKWKVMYQLARVWKLTDAADNETFRTMVNQICRKTQTIRYPFGSVFGINTFRDP